MLKWFDALSLRAKMTAGFAVLIVLALVAVGVSAMSHRQTLAAVNAFLDRDNRIAEITLKSGAAILKARRVILSDQRMPDVSGTEFLSKVKDLYPNTIRMILSGYTELESVIDAVNGARSIASTPSPGTTTPCARTCARRFAIKPNLVR